jgi:hypothetical protein
MKVPTGKSGEPSRTGIARGAIPPQEQGVPLGSRHLPSRSGEPSRTGSFQCVIPPHSEEIANPFCTRRVRPGAIPYLFPSGEDAVRVVERLRGNGWWGQIVGPHGSGKSTLLEALLPELQRVGRIPLHVALHNGQRRLPPGTSAALRALPPGAGIAIIDGYEQLSRWNRFWLRQLCRRRKYGLLVTTHQPSGLPELFQTDVTPQTARRVVELLLPDPPGALAAVDVAARLAVRAGNLREVLFELYDVYERQRKPPVGLATHRNSCTSA